MFLREELQSYTKRVCPNGHLDILSPILGDFRYCPRCGGELKKEPVPYSVFYCSHCNHKVDEAVIYCPYCGEKKEITT